MTFRAGDVVKCISDAPTTILRRNQTYTVCKVKVRPDGVQLVMIDPIHMDWWRAERFVPVTATAAASAPVPTVAPHPENVDTREERFRAMLTTTTDPYTCKKCGAPKATCTYH